MAQDELTAYKPHFIKKGPLEFHPIVFPVSALLILGFTLLAFFTARQDPEGTQAIFNNALEWIATNFGWFYILSANIFLFTTIFLIFSKVGQIRLGGDKATPDYSYGSWFAMLFSAGMGIGLLFWSVAEPMYHFGNAPRIIPDAAPEAAREAMKITFYHWGLHAWGIYAVVGAAIAFFAFNRGLPLTIRSTFYPIIGKRIHGWQGNTIDILAVVATLFGVATSLGLGVKQVNAGLNYVFPGLVESASSIPVQMILIAVITLAATISVVSGLDKGIKRLSEGNLLLGLLLMLMVLLIGPTVHLLDSLVQNIGHYIADLVPIAFWTEAYRSAEQSGSWQHSWTIFYWGWWISWSPFVGMFIARISRGRTIREFSLGVLLVPTLLTFIWLTVFGNAALEIEQFGGGGILAAVQENVATALFKLLEHFPLSFITSFIAIVVVITFFVTSSDSGSLVIDTITGGGHPHPPTIQKIFWAVTEGLVAAVLLYAGGLKALQAASITTGLPFALLLLIMVYSLLKGLNKEYDEGEPNEAHFKTPPHSPDVIGEHTWEDHHPKDEETT